MPPFVKRTADEEIVAYLRRLLAAAKNKPDLTGKTGYLIHDFVNSDLERQIYDVLVRCSPGDA